MKPGIKFRAETKYGKARDVKANKNLPIMAVVGTGDGVTAADPNRANFYWIRLVNDNNRLTQCWCQNLALSYGDVIYVAKARDEKLTFYEFVAFVQDAGGEPVPPICPKFAQVVYVSANGCHFTTVGAAVTYINSLAVGPAAGREFLIEVQAGTYTEAAIVTIPQYVHLRGQGEATIINMGDFDLNFSDDTSGESFNITGTGDDQWQVIHVVGDNVTLREIRATVTGAGNADIYIESVTGFEAYHIILETTQNTTYGFYFDDAIGLLWDCKVHDTSHWDYALFVDNNVGPCTVTTKYCEFRVRTSGYDAGTVAGSTWYHFACQFDPDNVNLAAGTHVALPTKRFNQEVIVAEEGGDFQALSEAITFINALGDAAANKLYGILMLGGNFAETGDVTVPRYVHVFGVGEGTEIEMGANTLFLDTDTSLSDVVVESSDPVAAIGVVAEDNVVMRHVRSIQSAGTGTPDCFYLNASTNVYLYDCIAEIAQNGVGYHVISGDADIFDCIALADTYSATTYGFQVTGTSAMKLYYCVADDDTYFGDALHIDNDLGCTCSSWWCHFTGHDNDVNVVGANATWEHFICQFDPDNSTLAGTETPLVTGDISQSAGADLFPDGDTAGIGARNITFWLSPQENFRVDFNWLTTGWAGAPFNGTPSTVNFTYRADLLACRHNVGSTRFFRYRTVNWTINTSYSVLARLWMSTWGAAGIRIDTGDDNDFAEIYVQATNTGLLDIVTRYRENGGGITTTTGTSQVPSQWYIVRLSITTANVVYPYYGIDAPDQCIVGAGGDIDNWSGVPTRLGVILRQDVANYWSYYDWLWTNVPVP